MPELSVAKPAQRAPQSVKVRFQSGPMLAAPGFLRWLQAMARFPKDRPQAIKILKATYPGLPSWSYGRIVDRQTVSETVDEAEAVIIVVTR